MKEYKKIDSRSPMMPFTIFQRLVIGNIAVLFLVALLGGVVSFNLKRLQSLNHELLVQNQESLFIGDQLIDSFELLVQFDKKYFVAKDTDYLTRFNQKKLNLKKAFQAFSLLMETAEQKQLLNESIQTFDDYLVWFTKKVFEIEAQKPINFDTLLKERTPYLQIIEGNLREILFLSRKIITQKTSITSQMTNQVLIITIITTMLTVLVGMLITVINTRSIRKSITHLKRKTKEISQGHFEQIHTFKGPKEIQDLTLHFNTMCLRLKELDALKTDFINHVSHELRTPITSIKEASTMLSKGFYDNDPDKRKQLLTLINEECQRLLTSAMRVLDYSKMEAHKMEYQTVNLNLPDLIRQSILKLAPLAQKKKISLEFTPPKSDLPLVCADKNRIIEVLDNLISNALNFTPSDEKIRIGCEQSEEKNKLTVTVEDNGPGIKPEHLEKIFHKFKQIDSKLNTHMGTGLGLSISKYIIKAHGGEIWAQSQLSNGTKISFTLPAVS